MAKGDTYTITLRGAGMRDVTAEKDGRVLEGEFSKDSGIQFFVVREKTRTGRTVKISRFAAMDVTAIETNFETE